MVDQKTRPPADHTRGAAIWATVIAVPVAVLVGFLILTRIVPHADSSAEPSASLGAPSASPGAAGAGDDGTGGTGPAVPMDAPTLSDRDQQVCLAVTSQLPATVRNLPARKVSAGPEQNAAYGTPPLTVACGVTRPTMCASPERTGDCVPLDAELLNMNRVCWYPEQVAGGTAFTTLDREVPVRVTVPKSYQQAAQWANEFSDIVVQTDKSVTEGVPSGCV
ncbi:DUF3515 family protein [Mangrovihabitans endophyticus]|uniref:DUF3515 domain-containing protein n=1 Tax=Mangrovihabitans endophyticus TaxID=1751298 RepID=A0A8J3FRZ1_9ACTN|nr:DUF3515 family protein [Mangrovihabitans endophyticus]GGL10905.1 hypothetical protein GCM10012284_52000 [Mangrovihabitans endophyticus]